MKSTYFIIGLFFIQAISFAQQNEESKPKTEFKVKKEYDANGNLKEYDSVYSYSYNGSINSDEWDSLQAELERNNFFLRDFHDDSNDLHWFFGFSMPEFRDIDSIMDELGKSYDQMDRYPHQYYFNYRKDSLLSDSIEQPNTFCFKFDTIPEQERSYNFSFNFDTLPDMNEFHNFYFKFDTVPDMDEFHNFSFHFDMDDYFKEFEDMMKDFEFFIVPDEFYDPHLNEPNEEKDLNPVPQPEPEHYKPQINTNNIIDI